MPNLTATSKKIMLNILSYIISIYIITCFDIPGDGSPNLAARFVELPKLYVWTPFKQAKGNGKTPYLTGVVKLTPGPGQILLSQRPYFNDPEVIN